MKIKPHLQLTGILKGVPFGTTKPLGKYVYQKVAAGLGNIPGSKNRREQVRRWVRGTQVNTPAQQPQRGRFALGVTAWHALTEPEKETYRVPAEKLHLNRFQLFMKIWCKTQPLPLHAVWDAGTTTWTSGNSQWDNGASVFDAGGSLWDGFSAVVWD